MDFEQLLHDLRSVYKLGFAGLFKVDEGISLFIQRQGDSTRMALGKINKICTKLADVVDIEEFETPEGELIESFGEFRSMGRKSQSGTQEVNVESKNTTTTTTTTKSHNTTNNTNCHNTTNTTNIHLHINALGEEDVSHINLEDLIGTREEVINRVKSLMSSNHRKKVMEEEWAISRRAERRRVRLWQRQQDPDLNIRESDSESTSESEPTLKRPPIYDPDSDSEENLKKRRACLDMGILKRFPEYKYEDFLTEFEELLFDNPHNSNIKARTKEKYFSFFDGESWIKSEKRQFFHEVTKSRIAKADEAFQKLTDEGKMSEFARDQVSSIINKLFDFSTGTEMELFLRDTREQVEKGILEAERNGDRLRKIASLLKRKIVRVGDKEGDVVHDSTWEDLEKMCQV